MLEGTPTVELSPFVYPISGPFDWMNPTVSPLTSLCHLNCPFKTLLAETLEGVPSKSQAYLIVDTISDLKAYPQGTLSQLVG